MKNLIVTLSEKSIDFLVTCSSNLKKITLNLVQKAKGPEVNGISRVILGGRESETVHPSSLYKK